MWGRAAGGRPLQPEGFFEGGGIVLHPRAKSQQKKKKLRRLNHYLTRLDVGTKNLPPNRLGDLRKTPHAGSGGAIGLVYLLLKKGQPKKREGEKRTDTLTFHTGNSAQ